MYFLLSPLNSNCSSPDTGFQFDQLVHAALVLCVSLTYTSRVTTYISIGLSNI